MAPKLQISDIKFSHNNHGNVFIGKITDNVFIGGEANDINTNIPKVILTGRGNGTAQSGVDLIASMGILVATIDPHLSPDERGQLLKELGLLDTDVDIHHLNNTVSRNGKEYALVSSDAAPFVITISNSQRNDGQQNLVER